MKKVSASDAQPGAPSDLSDEELMLLVAKGDEDAFRTLVNRHQQSALGFFAKLGARPEEAEDALQETFLRLHAYRSRYRPTSSFRSFLFTVAHNAWIDACRKRDRRRRHEVAFGDEERRLPAPERTPREERMDLSSALEQLSEGHRRVLVLSVYGGLGYAEVAQVMGIPEGTVKSRAYHALRRLRGLLQASQGQPVRR